MFCKTKTRAAFVWTSGTLAQDPLVVNHPTQKGFGYAPMISKYPLCLDCCFRTWFSMAGSGVCSLVGLRGPTPNSQPF